MRFPTVGEKTVAFAGYCNLWTVASCDGATNRLTLGPTLDSYDNDVTACALSDPDCRLAAARSSNAQPTGDLRCATNPSNPN